MSQTSSKFFSQANKQAFRNPWVIGWIVLVVIVFTVNAGMVTMAVVTSPGLVEEDYYERGRDHERNFQQRTEARSRLGWQVALSVPSKPIQGTPGAYSFTVADKQGQPVRNAEVVLKAYRPSDAAADFETVLAETGPGRYDAPITFALKGLWDLQVSVVHADDMYDISRRISVFGQ